MAHELKTVPGYFRVKMAPLAPQDVEAQEAVLLVEEVIFNNLGENWLWLNGFASISSK